MILFSFSPLTDRPASQRFGRVAHSPMSPLGVLKAVCLLGILSISIARGGLIYWGSEGFIDYKNSRNQAWTPDYSMALGVFKTGFTPTFANRGLWAENWVPLGLAQYDSEELRFAGVVDDSLSLPGGSGTQAYIWAKNGEDLTKGPEWMLMTNLDWQWPAVSFPNSPPLTWTTGAVASPLVGSLGQPIRDLITAGVRPVAVSLVDWLLARFPSQPENRTASGDPDGDGLSNQLEYFLGSNPANGSSMIHPSLAVDGSGTMLNLARNPFAESSFTLERSTSLNLWTALTLPPLIDRPDLIQVWVPATPGTSSAFFRFGLYPTIP